ncbi:MULTISPECIES: winged helix-turn-helix transcriptional regulator [Niallia]|uniref:winged helix-turn-helix transcriptional regulator n=1 Tax=Niallia TaxID=2837506 RepID=UPI00204211EE|nr:MULTISPECIES: response regulator transcription factor [Niallia]MCM3033326.1 response regulator transcription factor [Niallia sp. MER 6]MED4041074.1 response regulator transcription factor [Niallia taxi]
MNNILLIGASIEEKWNTLLTRNGYNCIGPINIEEIPNYIYSPLIDIVLIYDEHLSITVESICISINKISPAFIMVISSNINYSLVNILKSGADVCLFEPIYEDELIARINSLLRHKNKLTNDIFTYNNLELNIKKRKVHYREKIIPLSQIEIKILEMLIKNDNKVLSTDFLIDNIWEDNKISAQTLRSYIRNIRDKIRDAGFPVDKYLITVWGMGYIWKFD